MFEQQRRFVADAAHELRTPITALSLHAQNLDLFVTSEGRDRLAMLKTGIRRVGHLLEQLLALARQESEGVSRDLLTELDRVVADLLPQAQARSIDLGCERIEGIELSADPTALKVLLRNLLDNALRYTPTGGRVDINLYVEAEHAVICVENTGPRIPDADHVRVFEPLYRGAHTMAEGSGLGLSIVQRIVANLSGSIALENIAMSGCTGLRVAVTLPLRREHKAPKIEPRRRRPENPDSVFTKARWSKFLCHDTIAEIDANRGALRHGRSVNWTSSVVSSKVHPSPAYPAVGLGRTTAG